MERQVKVYDDAINDVPLVNGFNNDVSFLNIPFSYISILINGLLYCNLKAHNFHLIG
eukprot:Pgem_evm1s1482